MKRVLKHVALGAAALLAAASPASATLQLRISDGTVPGTVIIIDQGVGDSDPTLGVVTYSGAVGSQWLITVNTGTSKPVLGSAERPDIDLNSINISSTSGGTLYVDLTETEFTGSGPATFNIGGVTAGTVTTKTFVDYNDTPFAKTTLMGVLGPFVPGPLVGSTPANISATAPYSITMELEITHPGSGSTGLDAHFFVTPPSACAPDVTVRCGASLDPDVNPDLGKPQYNGSPECLPATFTYSDSSVANGDCSRIITRSWEIVDACGETNRCTQTITVIEDVLPVLNVPANVSVECDSIPPLGTATATDNCDTNVLVEYLGETRVDGQNPACAYSIIRTWKATDSCQNSVTNSQTISVVDSTKPELTVPANISVECSAVPPVGTASATDNCDPAPAVTYLGATTNASGCGSIITRTWKAADRCGNEITKSQTITVADTTRPTLNVPANVTIECGSALPTGNPSASDNCDATPTITYLGAITNGSGCSYTITRRWKAEDDCGNAVTNGQIITVRDTIAPTITSVPAGGDIGCNPLPSIATVKSQVTATDACGPVTINVSAVDGGTACASNRVFTITANDGCNTSAVRTVTYTANCGTSQVCGTFNFNGNTALSGTAGNIRTFTVNGVSVKASAFSRNRSNGAWGTAYLGAYSGGLGVTDSSEGDGSGNTHTTDNVGLDNYVLFEFSQPVTISRATLGYVVNDSDLSVWIGSFADPFNNHLNLSDAVLASFGYTEQNITALTGARTADLNAGGVTGNAVIIAADVLDTTPEDMFKIQLLEFCTIGACEPPVACKGSICGSVLRDCDANGSLSGEAGLAGWTVTLKNAAGTATLGTATTDASGNYCFTNLTNATYKVIVTPKADYTQTSDPDATKDHTTSVTIANCDNKTGVKFGYTGSKPGVFIKMTGPSTAKCGDTITYSICVTNTGNTCLYGGMVVNSPLLGGQIFHQTPVNPGEGFCFTKTYVVGANFSGTLANTATVIGDPPGSLANVSMAVTVNTTVTCTPPPSTGCTLTIGYYKNHPSDIAPLPINLGTAGGAKTLVVSSQTIGVNVLGQHTYGSPGNGITKLYAQLLAAKLNILRGASSSAVSSAISAADAFLATRNHLDWGTLTTTEKNNVAAWHTTLDKYNNGLIGPGHCGDQECNRALDLKCTTGSKSVKLIWTKSTEATSYKIMRGLKPEGPYTCIKSGHTTTNYTDTAVTNGVAYYYVVSAVKNGVAITDSDEVCATPAAALASPWKTTDIGAPGYPGAASLASGVFTINGGGDDIWNTADNFRYTYQAGSGDCSVIARVNGIGNTHGWAKAGVMIRESLTPGSKHAFMCVTPNNGVAFQSRNATGGSSANVNTTGPVAPYWVKITRVGNVFTGFASANGTTWTKIGEQTITMGATVNIGLAVTSHDDATLTTATFQNVTAKP